MAIEIKLHPLGTHLVVECIGEFDMQAAQMVFREALSAGRRMGYEKVLVDCRKVVGDPSTIQRFEFAKYAADLYVQEATKGHVRLAVVGYEPLVSRERFGQMVAQNRGMPTVITTDLNEALEWLGLPLSESEEPLDS